MMSVKRSKGDFKNLLIIFLVSFSSLWLLLFYFFSWEEFSFFYAYQNPDFAKEVFNAHGFSYHRIFPHLGFLFHLFDYNPLPYNILSLLIFGILSSLVYYFSKEVLELNKKTALFAGLIFAAGYFGMGTFITDTYSGFDGGIGTSLTLICLIVFDSILKKIRMWNLLLLIIFYGLAIYFFPTRTYSLPFLFFIIAFFKLKNITLSLLIGFLSLLPIYLSLHSQVGMYTNLVSHTDFKIKDFLKSLFENISNLFIPSLILKDGLIKILFGLMLFVLFLIKKDTRLVFLLLLVSLIGHLLVQVIAYQYFATWESWNHFHTSFVIFGAPTTAIILKKWPKLLTVLIVFTIILSNIQAWSNLNNHSSLLRYFYEGIQKEIPNRDRKTAVVVFTKEPRPLSPFIHLPTVSPEVYLPGFYHKKAADLKVVQSYQEAEEYLNTNKLTSDDLFVFIYSLNDLRNVSSEVRELIRKGETINLDNPEVTNINGYLPLKISFQIDEFQNHQDNLTTEEEQIAQYLSWSSKVEVTTDPEKPFEDRKKENLIDNDYETTWIPSIWKEPVSVIFKFPEEKNIDSIVWSVSRSNSWPQRTPSTYTLAVSKNGVDWRTVAEIKNGDKLLTNQYRIEKIDYNQPISWVRFEIYKTYEGVLPAIDDIQFIPSHLKNIEYEDFNSMLQKLKSKACLQWKTGEDDEFRIQRQACFKIQKDRVKPYEIMIEPRTEEITGFRIVDNKELPLRTKNFKVSYPHYSLK